MIHLLRTDSLHQDFVTLVRLLDAELKQRDGDDHAFFAQFNKIDSIRHVVVAYDGSEAVGCGAFKPYGEKDVEIKRMFVHTGHRGRGIAGVVLDDLEAWAKEEGYKNAVLETGLKQPEAIALYTKKGYQKIPNFGQYAGVESSVCFMKAL